MKPRQQIPTETNKGGPKVLVCSYIIGVKKLFKALPNYGKVIPIPKAKDN